MSNTQQSGDTGPETQTNQGFFNIVHKVGQQNELKDYFEIKQNILPWAVAVTEFLPRGGVGLILFIDFQFSSSFLLSLIHIFFLFYFEVIIFSNLVLFYSTPFLSNPLFRFQNPCNCCASTL